MNKPARVHRAPRALIAAVTLAAVTLSACTEPPVDYFQGYIEVEYLHLASAQSGTVENLATDRGFEVTPGQRLLNLESVREQAAVAEAQSRLQQAQAQWQDLGTGQRPEERAVIRAQLAQATTAADLSEREAQRRRQLVERKLLAIEQADEADSLAQRDQQRVRELRAQLTVSALPARQAQIEAAQAQVLSAQAALDQARWALQQRQLSSPTSGWVNEVYYRPGEWAVGGTPLLAITPSDRFEARFFVPTATAMQLKPGDQVRVGGPGLQQPLMATISYVADQAEYAPPLIFSQDRSEKLLFQLRARIDNRVGGELLRLSPGLPIEVRLP